MWRCSGAVALLLAIAGDSHAASTLELLDWACNPKTTLTDAGDDSALADCKLTKGEKTACDVIDGEPYTCFTPAKFTGKMLCNSNYLLLTIDVSTQQTLGWKIKGTVVVEIERTTTLEGSECRLQKKPKGTDGLGTFVRRAGTAKLEITFDAYGEGSITFLGGKVFGEKFEKHCARTAAPKGYVAAKKKGCLAFCPAPGAKAATSLECDLDEDTPTDGDWEPSPTTPIEPAIEPAIDSPLAL